MPTSTAARIASVILGLEAVGIAVLSMREFSALAGGDTASAPSAIALLVLTVIAAVAVFAFAVAVWRGLRWGRSGGVVTQIMILAVALGAATGAFADAGTAALIALPAIAGLLALISASRRAAADGGERPRAEE